MPSDKRYRILVVDDDRETLASHARMVRSFGYEVETAADGIEALAKLPLDIDLILLDGEMPHMDGFEVTTRIRKDPAFSHVPIVMVSGLTRPEDRRRALAVGINDFIGKPMDIEELRLRTKWLLELKAAHDRLLDHRGELERTVERRTRDLRTALEEMTEAKRLTHDAHLETIRRLTVAAESKDADMAGHIVRIGRYSEIVARGLALSPGVVESIAHAAPMHDVGKIGVPDRILLKPGKLDDEEWVVMRSHTTFGARILAGSPSPVIQMAERIALSHHEWWDGGGYPAGIGGEDIHLEGRICSVVDFFDALTMDRPYRSAVPYEKVLRMMEERAGSHFDPDVLEVFFRVREEIESIHAESR